MNRKAFLKKRMQLGLVNTSTDGVLKHCYDGKKVEYKVFGNSVQDGTPTPSVPVEVESVGTRTKNLFNKNGSYSNGYINNNGSLVVMEDLPIHTYDYIAVTPNTTYTIGNGNSNTNCQINFFTSDKTFMSRDTSLFNSHTGQFQTPSNCGFVSFSINYSVNYVDKFQLELGSTATDYETFGYKIPVVNRGKNFVNHMLTGTYSSGGITRTINADKSITLNGTNTGSGTMWIKLCEPFTLQAGTYTLSNHNDNVSFNTFTFYDDNYNFGASPETITHTVTKTFTTEKTIKPYIKVTAGTTLDNETIYPMIEKSSTVTNYEPYIEPVTTNIYLSEPLRKVGDYADYVDFARGKVVRKIRSITKNVNDMDNAYQDFPGWMNVEYIAQDYPNLNVGLYSCSNFKSNIAIQTNTPNISINTCNTISKLILPRTEFNMTQTEWKTMYPNLNVNVCYSLSTPVEEELDLPTICTKYGTNIIEIDTTIQPTIELKYRSKVKEQ